MNKIAANTTVTECTDFLMNAKGPQVNGRTDIKVSTNRCKHEGMPLRVVEGREFCMVHGWAN